MRVTLQDLLKERAACRKHNLVSLELAILTSQGDVAEELVLPQTAENLTDIFPVIVPAEAEFFHFRFKAEGLFMLLPVKLEVVHSAKKYCLKMILPR